MIATVLTVLGGIGLFLLGLTILTDGLKALAGNAIRHALGRYTRSPFTGAVAGALTTALVQSSSATTVTVVGFVGAGLLTFPQALGVIFGANIGSTATGWLVAIVGFKLKLGTLALPIVFLGAILRLFGKSRVRSLGWVMAGFGLLFVGLDVMQQSMAVFEGSVTPTDFPPDTLIGRFQLVLTGMVLTLITQASSVGVATALVALGAGAISFPQAGALVIGMDIGTTCTAALATVGGSSAMRQTGFAHVIYNTMTGLLAFFLLTPFTALVTTLQGGQIDNGQIALVSFHTTFNILGVVLVLPFARSFARLIEWIVPDRGAPLLRRLDPRLLADPAAAIDASVATIREITLQHLAVLDRQVDAKARRQPDLQEMQALQSAIEATVDYVERLRTGDRSEVEHSRHIAAMHALDHLERLHHRMLQQERIEAIPHDRRLTRLTTVLKGVAGGIPKALETLPDGSQGVLPVEKRLERLQEFLVRQDRLYREKVLNAAAHQTIDADTALLRLDAMRWLQRTAYHLWRIVHHLAAAEGTLQREAVSENSDR